MPWSSYHGAAKLLGKQKYFLAGLRCGAFCSARAGAKDAAAVAAAGFFFLSLL
jgi:hypothetical protein